MSEIHKLPRCIDDGQNESLHRYTENRYYSYSFQNLARMHVYTSRVYLKCESTLI